MQKTANANKLWSVCKFYQKHIVYHMENRIAGFDKSDHFIYRQWDRGIDDKLLSKILNRIETGTEEFILVVSRNLIKKLIGKKTQELFIKIKGKILITCYYGDLDYQRTKYKNESYRILQ